ncbi:MAG: glycosyltransferase [Pseudomonadota bacterium]
MAKQRDPDSEIARLKAHIAKLEDERDRLKRRDRSYQALFDRVTDNLSSDRPHMAHGPNRFQGMTFVIVYYDIPRQIERTLQSCAPDYQGMPEDQIEVILVDNGSPTPLPDDLQARFPHVKEILRIEGQPSPVTALNAGIKAANFDMIALMIDGAHMLSPGVVRDARDVWGIFPNPVINVPQYMLGAESQSLNPHPMAFEAEGEALARLGWPEDGYALFEYAVYPGEQYHRTYVAAVETNCLITTRHVLDTCGGFDPRYDEPGGGFANLEIFTRLIHEPDNSYVVLPGEGTFHQDHSGTTTQRSPEERDQLVEDYRRKHAEVTGDDTVLNTRSPFAFGKMRKVTQRIPTISRAFGSASNRVQRQLADIFVGRLRAGMTDKLTLELASGGVPDERKARVPLAPMGLLPTAAERNGVNAKRLSYLTCLKIVHEAVQPKLYFEIGIDTGDSLGLAKCPSVGVDPAYMLQSAFNAPTRVFREKSDDFFAKEERCAKVLKGGIDLAFIDGMHLAEFVLRDFIETEKWMTKGGVILFDDVLPEQMPMVWRERRYNAWCGDVFKIVPILRKYRPDLNVSVFETFIGPYRKGLAVVSGVDPENTVLRDAYSKIEADILNGAYDVSSIPQLDHIMQPEPISGLTQAAKPGGAPRTRNMIPDQAFGPALPDVPKLSLVVVAYNMARELPRTLASLSPEVQKGVSAEDYEIIVVDNGSSAPADIEACLMAAPNARVVTLPAGPASPCHAANHGVLLSRAGRVGVLIDGARMVSPGLVSKALEGLAADEARVVGTHGFHLGKKVQSEAVREGYDTAQEDALLASSDWQSDGYKLFDISVFSKSSGKGWDVLPSESNAVFMHKSLWFRLGGYDERFASPGGGLTNLDLWKRACEADGVTVRMLAGEGTFHQIHGGVTTNAATSKRAQMDAEYEAIRGAPYKRPDVPFEMIGSPREAAGKLSA